MMSQAASSATGRWYAPRRDPAWSCPAPVSAIDFHRSLEGYAPTSLVELPQLAAETGVGRVFAKDESSRLALPAFKALGASWAIRRVLDEHPPGTHLTIVTATDGNHGRAVARFARLLGQSATIVVPRAVHPAAVAAIAGRGCAGRARGRRLRRRRRGGRCRRRGLRIGAGAGHCLGRLRARARLDRRRLRHLAGGGGRAAEGGGGRRSRPCAGSDRGRLAAAGRAGPLPQPPRAGRHRDRGGGAHGRGLPTAEPRRRASRHGPDGPHQHGRPQLRYAVLPRLAVHRRRPGRRDQRHR